MDKRDDRTAIFAFLILIAHVALGRLISRWMGTPSHFTWDIWLRRFAVRSATLRPATLAACLTLAASQGGLGRWGWRSKRPTRAFLLGCAASAAFASLYLARASTVVFSHGQLAVGWASAASVALFEEALFRGLIFLSLRARLGAFGAALASSAVFTFYHTVAVDCWASIFMFGFCACACLHAGLGLPWLMLLHALVDGAWFHSGADFRLPVAQPAVFWLAHAALYGACVRGIFLLREKDGLLAEVGGSA
ncbi:MAG: CPBP family intramembrane metalloprotease [Elusimicrobia bacterium]|nr:CPBP family intramembrane metalloprotease [Elusimicrobiota bacterium]